MGENGGNRGNDALDKTGAKHIQDSVWGGDIDDKAKAVFDYLGQHKPDEKDGCW
jgi:hypothetical protein